MKKKSVFVPAAVLIVTMGGIWRSLHAAEGELQKYVGTWQLKGCNIGKDKFDRNLVIKALEGGEDIDVYYQTPAGLVKNFSTLPENFVKFNPGLGLMKTVTEIQKRPKIVVAAIHQLLRPGEKLTAMLGTNLTMFEIDPATDELVYSRMGYTYQILAGVAAATGGYSEKEIDSGEMHCRFSRLAE